MVAGVNSFIRAFAIKSEAVLMIVLKSPGDVQELFSCFMDLVASFRVSAAASLCCYVGIHHYFDLPRLSIKVLPLVRLFNSPAPRHDFALPFLTWIGTPAKLAFVSDSPCT
eukprot:708826-Hanusia_phi.AAC.3